MGVRADRQAGGQRPKLIEAGYRFARGEDRERPAEEYQFINVPTKPKDTNFYVHHECWDAFEVFRTCYSQWRLTGIGDRYALDYTAIVCVAQFMGHDPGILQEIRFLEIGALAAFNGRDLETLIYG